MCQTGRVAVEDMKEAIQQSMARYGEEHEIACELGGEDPFYLLLDEGLMIEREELATRRDGLIGRLSEMRRYL